MKVLTIGSKGNMGRRYTAILNHLKVDNRAIDVQGSIQDSLADDITHVIVATPTHTHVDVISDVISASKPGLKILCEKPIYKNSEVIRTIERVSDKHWCDVRMVCNWAFIFPGEILSPRSCRVQYDCYNTGKDGTAWDCIQIIHLSKGVPLIRTESPTFECVIEKEGVRNVVSLDDIAASYVRMVNQWLDDHTKLWGMDDAIRATERVEKLIEEGIL